MNELQIVKTEQFCGVDCDFYSNTDGKMLMTREQVGTALEYTDPQKALDNIHSKHKDRLDKLSITLKVRGKTGQEYPTTVYSTRGVMEICRWSKQPKADAFMDFAWDVMEKVMADKELQQSFFQREMQNYNIMMQQMTFITEEYKALKKEHEPPYKILTYFSEWKSNINSRIRPVIDYYGYEKKKVFSMIYREISDSYGINLGELKKNYCEENEVPDCYVLDVIDSNDYLKDMFDTQLDFMLEKILK